MVFVKSFLLSLAVLVGVNFLFIILSSFINDTIDILFSVFESGPNYAPLMILYYLFGSITMVPSISIGIIVNFELNTLIVGIGYVLAPLIAAILSGRFGESKAEAIGGWLLSAGISAGAIIIGLFLSPTVEGFLAVLYGTTSQMTILINVCISLFINFLAYGFFALLICKTEYY